MRKLIVFLLILECFTVKATNHYFTSAGDDGNTGTLASPWKTINKFNSAFPTIAVGDSMLFHRGEIFTGTMNIGRAGTALLPIVVGAYGSGAAPIISGFTTVSGWTNIGPNIWESNNTVSALTTCSMVTINGTNTAMGRTPNADAASPYYVWSGHGGSGASSTLTSTANLNTAVINWAGAEVAFFGATYIMYRFAITGQVGNTITYNASAAAAPLVFQASAPGYFLQQFHIQNDLRTLDEQNEWYYNVSNHKLDIYSVGAPSATVKVASTTTQVLWPSFKDFVVIRDLTFEGANANCMQVGGIKFTRVVNCTFNNIGGNGIYGQSFGGTPFYNNQVDSCVFNGANNSAIDVTEQYVVRHNSFSNIGMLMGMNMYSADGLSMSPNSTGIAVRVRDDSSIVSDNSFTDIGLVAIYWSAGATNPSSRHFRIYNNYIVRACNGYGYRDDGAIYCWNGNSVPMSDNIIYNNIILGTGNPLSGVFCQGIYFDAKCTGTEIYGCTIEGGEWGIWAGLSVFGLNIHDNTTYNCKVSGLTIDARTKDPSNNFIVLDNILVARLSDQFSIWTLATGTANMPTPFTSNRNYYAKPISINTSIQSYLTARTPNVNVTLTLAQYQTLNGQDANSHISPMSISNVNDLRLEYNETDINKTISLPFDYIDVKSTHYNGTITLTPHTSAVLIKFGPVSGLTSPTFNHINHNNIIH